MNVFFGCFTFSAADREALFRRSLRSSVVFFSFILLCTAIPHAHPHVFVDARPDLVFDAQGLKGIRQHWIFDEMYSAALLAGIDVNRDGLITGPELDSLDKHVIQPAQRFGYFTHLAQGDNFLPFTSATDLRGRIEKKRLVCDFFLPVKVRAGSDYAMLLLVLADPVNYTQMTSFMENSQVKAPHGIEVEFFTDDVSGMTLFKELPSQTQGLFFRFRRMP